jgi:hypothetical protein
VGEWWLELQGEASQMSLDQKLDRLCVTVSMIRRKMVGRGGRIGSVLPRSDVAGGCWGFRFRQNDIVP